MRFKYCKLIPRAPLHLGERESWQEGSSVFIHSDTLFSGLCHCYGLLYGEGELKSFLDAVQNEKMLQISSAFPFWKDRLYWPVPKNQIPEAKEAYKIKFIEQAGFEKLLAGERLENLCNTGIGVIPAKENPQTPWKLANVPRISLNRLNNHPLKDGGFFYSGRVSYRKHAGFFFLYQVNDQKIEKRFEASLRLLVEEGIGGDRSAGNGLMEIDKFDTIDINVPNNADAEITISLYYPEKDEIQSFEQGYYELIERKGYIYSPYGQTLRRCSLRMFTEGSVFPILEQRKGKLKNVKPDAFTNHKIFRYGMFIGFPCKKEVNPA